MIHSDLWLWDPIHPPNVGTRQILHSPQNHMAQNPLKQNPLAIHPTPSTLNPSFKTRKPDLEFFSDMICLWSIVYWLSSPKSLPKKSVEVESWSSEWESVERAREERWLKQTERNQRHFWERLQTRQPTKANVLFWHHADDLTARRCLAGTWDTIVQYIAHIHKLIELHRRKMPCGW